ncbi:transient receptor potential cation channel subfamily M member 2-like [Saccostrea cucullata]|uniref:transient receptor potential cation channel subfamily M member 2-like n=1 Tax=Saccostrea cuccullata TaxID=36930 RepID=UPI002ED14556
MDRNNWRKQIKSFVTKVYSKSQPNMIFSVIGDSDNLIPKPWPKSRFQQSLTYAAKAAGNCLILSKGEPLKVSKIVREMMEEYIYLEKPARPNLRLISVPSKPVEDTGLYFDLPEVLEFDENQSNRDEGQGQGKDEEAEFYADDSFFCKLPARTADEDYIDFRAELERTLERPTFEERNALVLILVEGDLSAVDHVKLATENGIPVVFMKGTGGLADLITIAMEDSNMEIRTLLPVLFGIELDDTDHEIETLEESLKTILERSYLIDHFDLVEKNEEQFAALVGELVQKSRLLENTGPSKNHTLEPNWDTKNKARNRKSSYAMADKWTWEKKPWRMAETLETLDFKTFSSPFSLPLDLFFRFSKFLELKRNKTSSEQVEKGAQELLKIALLTNRTDYLEALLDLNVPLSLDVIGELYKCALPVDGTEKNDSSGMRWVLMEMGGKHKLAKHLFEGEKDCHEVAQKMCKRLLNYKKTEIDVHSSSIYKSKRMREYVNRQDFLQAVLLWSLLTHRTDIATLVWRRVKSQLYTGLVSALILKKMSSIAKLKDEKLAMKLKEQAKDLRGRILSMMDNLYQTDETLAFEILDEVDVVWTIEAKPLSFVYESKMYDIIAHPCSVGLMNKIWFNGLIPSGTRFCTDFLKQYREAVRAPFFHFVLHYIFFGFILLMYGYAVLTPLKTYDKTPLLLLVCEFALYGWTCLDFLNDIASVVGVMPTRANCSCTSVDTKRKAGYKFLSRLNDMWKVLGLVCVLLTVATVFSRLKPTETFKMATRFCALLLLFSFLRYMRIFVIYQLTGITFIFLKHMLLHLVQFLFTIAFFVLGVGVFIEAIVHQENQLELFPGVWYEWRIWRIIYYPYYQYYGEVFDGDFGIKKSNDEVDWSVKAVVAIHIMVGNLLIVNLIIALFTTKYEKVHEKSALIWQYERYHVIQDFRHRLFANLHFLICCCLAMRAKSGKHNDKVRKELKRIRERQIIQYIMAGRSLGK